MSHHDHHHDESHDHAELVGFTIIHRDLEEIIRVLRRIVRDIEPQLSSIRIAFGGIAMSLGPVTLSIGQKTIATVQGFDQNGAPFAIDFTANPVTFSIDNSAIATATPESDPSKADVVGVSAGVANLTATCAGFTDVETVTVTAITPVLSSIKVDFSTPA